MGKKRTPQLGASQGDSADTDVFRAAMRDVTPLAHPPRHEPPRPKLRTRKRSQPAASVDDIDQAMPLISAVAEDESGAATLAFQRGGVRDQVMRRLRRGLYPTEAELDLHGLSQTEARDRLADFIARSRDIFAFVKAEFDEIEAAAYFSDLGL